MNVFCWIDRNENEEIDFRHLQILQRVNIFIKIDLIMIVYKKYNGFILVEEIPIPSKNNNNDGDDIESNGKRM